MKIVPSEFSNSAWDNFVLSKEITHNNFQQNVDSENIFLAIIKQDFLAREIIKKNGLDVEKIETELVSLLDAKSKMKNKQENLYIG